MADDLSAQGNRLRARQTKSSLHEPEKLTPTPAVTLRVDVNFLAQGLEETGSLSGEVTQGGGGGDAERIVGGDWLRRRAPVSLVAPMIV